MSGPGETDNVDTSESSLRNIVGRKPPACTHCGRPTLGHDGPVGKKCPLEPMNDDTAGLQFISTTPGQPADNTMTAILHSLKAITDQQSQMQESIRKLQSVETADRSQANAINPTASVQDLREIRSLESEVEQQMRKDPIMTTFAAPTSAGNNTIYQPACYNTCISDNLTNDCSSRQKSGILLRSSDIVKRQEKYPHSFLFYEDSNVSYSNLTMPQFVSGFSCILMSDISEIERQGRTRHLAKLMHFAISYPWFVILQLHKAVVLAIELGRKEWSDDFSDVENSVLLGFANRPKISSASHYTNGPRPNNGVFYCANFQSNSCNFKQKTHSQLIAGVEREVWHICKKCWLSKREKCFHSLSSDVCPFKSK